MRLLSPPPLVTVAFVSLLGVCWLAGCSSEPSIPPTNAAKSPVSDSADSVAATTETAENTENTATAETSSEIGDSSKLPAKAVAESNTPTVDPTTTADDAVTVQAVTPKQFHEHLAKLKGKVVLVDYWATWCVPCRKGFPHTVELFHEHKDDGFVAVSMAMEHQDNSEAVLEFLSEQHAIFANFLSAVEDIDELFTTYEITGGSLPHYKLYDRSGQLRHTFATDELAEKQFTQQDIAQRVRELLKEKP